MSNTDTEPTGWVAPDDRTSSKVFHTNRDCRKFPTDSARPLGQNEIVSRDLRECELCANDGQQNGDKTPRVTCPWCGESTTLRYHLPCPDGGESDE